MKITPVIFLLFIFITSTFPGNNLPQLNIEKSILGKDHKQIFTYFNPLEIPPPSLDDSIGKIILKYLPKEYKIGCKEMISKWGSTVKGTESTVLRVMAIKNIPGSAQHVFLALTCFSTAPGYGDKYYDERLLTLSIQSDSTKLKFIPSGKPCNECSELTHIGLEDDTLSIGGEPAISINYGSSTTNPCCDGSVSVIEHKIKFFQITKLGIKELLSLTMERSETFHDDVMGDSTVQYTSLIDFEKDKNGTINRVNLNHRTTINDSISNRGVTWYTWNRKAKRFDEGAR
ncbi:MAG: hypothetical protein HZB59_04960 [Ignavibacteriales bacterium]|nr:hypothetical protein [Ignavibacteriales bacterium]